MFYRVLHFVRRQRVLQAILMDRGQARRAYYDSLHFCKIVKSGSLMAEFNNVKVCHREKLLFHSRKRDGLNATSVLLTM